jgi:hypothetical protein
MHTLDSSESWNMMRLCLCYRRRRVEYTDGSWGEGMTRSSFDDEHKAARENLEAPKVRPLPATVRDSTIVHDPSPAEVQKPR